MATETTEPLATGWGPETDQTDTITRRFLFHWAATCEAFTRSVQGRVARGHRFIGTDYGRESGYFNCIVLLQPPREDDIDELLAEIDDFTADGSGRIELLSLWPTPDLRPRGWTLEGHPPLLIRPPSGVPTPTGARDLDVRRVTSPAALHDWERVAIEGYPLPDIDSAVPGGLVTPAILDDDRVRMWVGYENDTAVSIGTSFVEDDLAGFAFGVTRPEARGSGHWNVHARLRIAATPAHWMAGLFSDYSRPLAERIGFVPITRFTLWSLAR